MEKFERNDRRFILTCLAVIAVGAVLTGLLWRAALAGFSRYVRDLNRFSVHGSIAAVVVFLVWVYISAVIFLYGVEVTAAYARLRRRRPDEIPAAPSPRTTRRGILCAT